MKTTDQKDDVQFLRSRAQWWREYAKKGRDFQRTTRKQLADFFDRTADLLEQQRCEELSPKRSAG
jgi:hypothetical protein